MSMWVESKNIQCDVSTNMYGKVSFFNRSAACESTQFLPYIALKLQCSKFEAAVYNNNYVNNHILSPRQM